MSASGGARRSVIGQALASWARLVARVAPLVVLVALAGAVAAGFYTARHLGIDTDTADMLAADLAWRIENERHKHAFPQYADNIVVVIEGATSDLAAAAQRRLGERLLAEPERFQDVHLAGGGPFFEGHALLYVDVEELAEIAEGLEEARSWLPRLEGDPSLEVFLSVLDSLLTDPAEDGNRPIALLGAVGQAFEGSMVDRVQPIPWPAMMRGRESPPERLRRYIEVLPRLDFDRLFPGEPAIQRIRTLADSLHLTEKEGVGVRLTGFVPMSDEELRSAAGGLRTAGVLALLMVSLILYAGLRSWRLIAASLVTLLVGLLFTAAFAALAVRQLNLISMAFAVLYIGLGIDYAIHYVLRYRELRTRGEASHEALARTAEDVGTSLLLSAVTTAACFYAFVPTDFEGVSELGLIGGTGMLISFVTTVTLLPALLTLLPFRPKPEEPPLVGGVLAGSLARAISGRRPAILAGAAIFGLASLALLPGVRFDLDPLALRDPGGESTATYMELLADSTAYPMTVSILTASAEEGAELAGALERLEQVKEAVTIRDFVPEDQDAKLAAIQRIGLAIAPSVPPTRTGALPTDHLAAVDSFRVRVRGLELEGEEADLARFAAFQLRSWLRWAEGLPDAGRERAVARVEESLTGGLRRSLGDLRRSLGARPVSMDSLPRDLVQRWVAGDGTSRVEVIPRQNLGDRDALRAFVTAVHSLAPRATGEPVINVRAGEAVVSAFRQALTAATAATLVLLLVALRSVVDTLRVIVPLLLAGLLTAAATVVFRSDFNYANVIALPLLLGVGVDNGIHMVHRMRSTAAGGRPGSSGGSVLGTSTARAVLYASLTTIFSFGNLAFSSHPGTASMGRLLTVGMLSVLACTLLVLPALALRRRDAGV